MWADSETIVFFVAAAVQVAGFTSVAIARLGQRPQSQLSYQWFFFICLVMVALFSLLATLTGHGSWLINGTTLAMMAVGATLDTGRAAPTDCF